MYKYTSSQSLVITNNLLESKFLLGVVIIAFVFTASVIFVDTAKAATNCSITATLKIGSKGAQVKCLQTLVGASPIDGNFGKMTKVKVIAWQKSNGLVADGVFGTKSRAKINTIATVPVVPNNTGVLTGGAGNISSTTLLGSPSNVQVGEGTPDVPVLGFQVRADAGSDLNIQNVRVNLVATGSGSTWPSRYISNITIWQGSTKVGSVDVANLSQNGTTYNATVPLSGAVVMKNSVSNFQIAVTSDDLIDSSDANNSFNVFVDSIRYSDASGAILTTSLSGITQPMRFLKLANSASVKLILSEDPSNPKDRTVVVNHTSTTSDVSLLKFSLKAEGSDMYLGALTLPVTATGVTNANQISSYYKLKYDGRVISSFTDTQTGTTPDITFGDDTVTGSTLLDGSVASVYIPAGISASFEVVADINKMCDGVSTTSPCTGVTSTEFDAGDTLKVDFPSATLQSSNVYVENQVGDYLSESSVNRTGSATGYAATFRIQGVSANYVSNSWNSPVAPTRNTSGVLTSETATTTVTVTAVGNDFFINKTADYVPNTTLGAKDSSANTSYGFNLAILNGSDQYVTTTEVTAASVSPSVSCTSGCIQQGISLMKIPSGTTATFVISTALTDNSSIAAGGYKVAVFSTTASPNSDGSSPAAYTNTPSYNFVTSISDTFQ